MKEHPGYRQFTKRDDLRERRDGVIKKDTGLTEAEITSALSLLETANLVDTKERGEGETHYQINRHGLQEASNIRDRGQMMFSNQYLSLFTVILGISAIFQVMVQMLAAESSMISSLSLPFFGVIAILLALTFVTALQQHDARRAVRRYRYRLAKKDLFDVFKA